MKMFAFSGVKHKVQSGTYAIRRVDKNYTGINKYPSFLKKK